SKVDFPWSTCPTITMFKLSDGFERVSFIPRLQNVQTGSPASRRGGKTGGVPSEVRRGFFRPENAAGCLFQHSAVTCSRLCAATPSHALHPAHGPIAPPP